MISSRSHHIRSVAVFCGSRFGNDPAYRDAADALGAGIAKAGWRLVYGGGRVGLMGVVADAVLAGGGTVFGVIPRFPAAPRSRPWRRGRPRHHRDDA